MAENDLVKKKPGPKKLHRANFKPGNPGGPGRPPIPEDIKLVRKKFQELREQNSLEMQLMIDNLRRLPNAELEALFLTEIPIDQAIIIKGLLTAREKADLQVIQTLRTITAGPEVKQVELSGANGQPLSSGITPEEMLATWTRIRYELKEERCRLIQSSPQLLASPQPSSAGELLGKRSDD